MKKYRKPYDTNHLLVNIIVALMIAASSTLILVTPLTVRLEGIHGLAKEYLVSTAKSLELGIDEEMVDEGLVQLEKTGIPEALREIVPDEIEAGISMYDIKMVCESYEEIRDFTKTEIRSFEDLGNIFIGMILADYLKANFANEIDQINMAVDGYSFFYYILIGLALLSIILVLFRKRGAVYLWLIPALIFTLVWVSASLIWSSIIGEVIAQNLYIKFPWGMVAGFVLVLAAEIIYHRRLKKARESWAGAEAENTEAVGKGIAGKAEDTEAVVKGTASEAGNTEAVVKGTTSEAKDTEAVVHGEVAEAEKKL
ncbi:MAG: hypothetical protein K5989_04305 [Lachnospiraceae bacterium]|nr:hypothetical protein [Lachnospiraceae bacterium]